MLYRELQTTPRIEIGERQRIAFLHIPKAAGSTFLDILRRQFTMADFYPWYHMGDEWEDSSDYKVYAGHFYRSMLRRVAGDDAIMLSFFRNPVQRTISEYYQLRENLRLEPLATPGLPETLEAFILHPDFKHYTFDVQTRMLATPLEGSSPAEMREAWFQSTVNPEAAPRIPAEAAYPAVDALEFVGLTERFSDSIAVLSHTFGWEPAFDTPRRNVGSYRLPGQETIDKIIELNREDLKLYEYVKQVFNARFAQMQRDVSKKAYYLNRMTSTPRMHLWRLGFESSPSGSWHFVERRADGTPFVWTGPGTRSSLEAPLAPGIDLRVTFLVVNAGDVSVLDSIRLFVNGSPVPLDRAPQADGSFEFWGVIPRENIPEDRYFSEIAFEINKTHRPIDLDPANPDDRDLGIALAMLDISPAYLTPTDTVEAVPANTRQPYHAHVEVDETSVSMRPGATHLLSIRVENRSDSRWDVQDAEAGEVKIGCLWTTADRQPVSGGEAYAALLSPLAPGEHATLMLPLTAPDAPGDYIVQINAVQQIAGWLTTWFDTPPVLLTVEVRA